MLSLKVMVVLVFILLSIKDTTIAHTTTHDQVKEKIVIVDEAGNDIDHKEVYGRVKGNRASLMDFNAADYHVATTHPPRNN
uniref:Uncharacterized protein n=1 Tax=Solanum lycopersicum TaxID=4081 RepID=A0A3Q7H0J3_SOLLC